MSGRGYLKKRLAELKLKAEADEAMNQQNLNAVDIHENRNSIICNGVKKLPESTTQPQSQSMMNLQKQPSHSETPKEKMILHEINTVPPICRPKSTALPQSQSIMNLQHTMPIETEIEKMDPVKCRVPPKSEKNNYKIIQLESNYLKIEKNENVGLYEYNVNFNPLVDARSARFYLLYQHKDLFPVKTYDGSILFVPTMLQNKVTILMGKLKDESEVTITITYRLEIWPGYVININEYENGLYLCVDVSHRVLCVETVLESIAAYSSKNHDANFKQMILALLIGSTVITRYNQKNYLIEDIDFSMSPLSKFKHHDTEILYFEYYKKMYDIKIKNLNQFMIITKPKKKNINNPKHQDSDVCCLVPELCCLTGLSQNMKEDFKLMSEIHNRIESSPELRQHALLDIVNRINDASQILNKWGLKLHQIPIKLEGPVYKKESIIFGNKKVFETSNKMDWKLDNVMITVENLNNWAIFYPQKDSSSVKLFCKKLNDCAKKMGTIIQNPMCITTNTNSPENVVYKLHNIVMNNSDLQLVVIILSSQREDIYNAIKRFCCADIGIPSQVILSRTLDKQLDVITKKIALQINCKLGGAGWTISIPLELIFTMISIIICLALSVGIVASLNKLCTEWYSIAKCQQNTHQELLTSVQISFHKLLNKYKEVNHVLPEKIIIYRDGVSDGELQLVNEFELKNIRDCFKFIDEQYKNPPSGTVIDNTITRRNVFDFFLVSQHMTKGTVNPTHYIVLKNESNLSAENVQRLTYKLCHLYYNWCGTIKVPSPVQYAHKLAYLVGQNLKKLPNEKLNNTLFFL